ncbi:DUF2461 domain-containing protein [Spirosoma utsteinense]|uniref:TIGR02453 family protein n=1 Tax=Spirosoma utsteinense TaxID=2585773 RepID=A0ABR6W1Z1_9BACT|nr:DUF2461 domain-containing protein [Spirosoma utsteinense]MBC3785162.1 putative protein (TIGR02453 family) [Spirosoma utsteinense]MBC3790613.1 putative protein (TIGR02453 family) [Spirosoma utsteinense]
MLQPSTLTFLSDLKANNNKPWFDANRLVYEAARNNFIDLVARLLEGINTIDPAISETALQAKSCIFRINRDVRFSTDKSPYKSYFGAWFNAGGKQSPTAGYYLDLRPGGSFVAGGLYMPDAAILATIRQEIDYNLANFEQILTQPAFVKQLGELNRDEVLQRPPKGYDASNPAIEYLKLKSFTASRQLPDSALTKPDLVKQILTTFSSLQPLITYLNTAVVP